MHKYIQYIYINTYFISTDLIYHATESSTSGEGSPTLPRRSFHRKRDRNVNQR